MDKLTAGSTEGSVIVFTVWNDATDLLSGWHAMTALYTGGKYLVFNQYNNSVTYEEYESLEEAYQGGFLIYGIRID